MYLAGTRAADQAAARATPESPDQPPVRRSKVLSRVPGTVLVLGIVSLVTDISAEMVTAILPLYLVFGLGLNPLQFGLLDGLYAGATAVLRLVGGHLADRWQRLKAIAGIGYGLSAVAKLGFLAAGSSVPAIGAVLAVDRAGKGIRTAPRDAIISLSTPPEDQGRAFGVHRTLDTIGAFLGPLVAAAILFLALNNYDAVFVTSFALATCAVLILLALAPNQHRRKTESNRPSIRESLNLLREASFRRCCVWAAALGLFTITDSFVYLALQRRWDLDTHFFPLLPIGTAGTFILLAIPLGRLGDRIGRWKVFIGGHLALVAALVLIFGPVGTWWLVLALHGAFYAATDGVLPAAAGPMLPEHLRATGLAVLQTGQALARMASAVTVGLLWTVWDVKPALLAITAALLVVTLAAAIRRPLEAIR
ncbi:MFS transporter [Kribbella sandramycini]|uniref:MFS family permease n=1 Tax=Kribbella sandramycini TaxID=60450 RepID=A0A7Y4KY68_9ACTN|nr:MFS transporter [Kribbella sandramycini]MBB6567555.1 MFS family permease [Kribbella sandramycini]NOL39841.1 MFS transporter [Kribbella sandramycini]